MKLTGFLVIFMVFAAVNAQTDPLLSCKHRCLHVYDNTLPCQCNDVCADYGNCCSDFYTEACDQASYSSCAKRCMIVYDWDEDCQCNDQCKQNSNCCPDFDDVGCPYIQSGVTTLQPGTLTPPAMFPDSCAGRCGSKYNRTAECQCDPYCTGFNDCCDDVKTRCSNLFPTEPSPVTTTPPTLLDSCVDRCGDGLDSNFNCQCNSACVTYQDCCADYSSICIPINFDEFVSELWANDVNRIPDQYYAADYQAFKQDYGNQADLAPNNLFTTFDETYIYNQGTFQTFLNLCDNYEPYETIPEDDTASDQIEVEEFLDDIFNTEVMEITTQTLIDAGEISNEADLRAIILEIWFTHYNRKADFDSSGFEHVFCGEFKTASSVNGFHNWVTLYQREKTGDLNYHGWTGQAEPNQLGLQFKWNGAIKSRSSIVLGVSPEFELAVFTACWIINPNAITTFTVTDGSDTYDMSVQAYVQDGKYVGTCYFVV
ncbi:putative poly(U)-specific endoribonuclease-like isoform X1 [Apostichopus japonicus]|uniref:Uridylate-specific endoribonuclease n=1 Tax=Stichopus japonicus TaxID=307972 RepID=A0A2G8LQI0_STIJA|nr:putative poly(U)-specific endoribonuclease-like isoform X1 [Apostichopus japonicus]